MATHAVADVLRENDVREVVDRLLVADDDVVRPGLHARQVLAAMDLVDHDLHVHGQARVGINGLRLVARHAQLDVLARAAMRGQHVVALVARRVRRLVPVSVTSWPSGQVASTLSCSSSWEIKGGEISRRVGPASVCVLVWS
jgi:hypothetical protein